MRQSPAITTTFLMDLDVSKAGYMDSLWSWHQKPLKINEVCSDESLFLGHFAHFHRRSDEVLVSGSVQPSSTGGLTGEVWSINSFDEVSITAFLDPPWSLRKTGARKIFKQFFLPAIYIESSDFLIGSKEGWLLDFLRCKTGHKTQFWKVACFIPRGVLRMWCFKLWPFMTLELSLVKNCVVY